MGEVGCYTLDLYCDHYDCMAQWDYGGRPQSYTGPSRSYCVRNARKDGWMITKKRRTENVGSWFCLCPLHSGKRKVIQH